MNQTSVLTDTNRMLPVAELSRLSGVNAEALRKRLVRWRQACTYGRDWIEARAVRANAPRVLYRIEAVRHLLIA